MSERASKQAVAAASKLKLNEGDTRKAAAQSDRARGFLGTRGLGWGRAPARGRGARPGAAPGAASRAAAGDEAEPRGGERKERGSSGRGEHDGGRSGMFRAVALGTSSQPCGTPPDALSLYALGSDGRLITVAGYVHPMPTPVGQGQTRVRITGWQDPCVALRFQGKPGHDMEKFTKTHDVF